MANNYFEFKQFTIYQDKAAMKVGTDGVLLGAWARVDKASRILDIGTGTGLIAIMCAQRNSEAIIEALEIDNLASEQAQENIDICPWTSRLSIINKSLQDYNPSEKYDSIISNPPFFVNSTKAACNKKSTARHTDSLPFEDIIAFAIKHLNTDGILSIVLPIVEGEEFISIAHSIGMFINRKTLVIPKPGSIPKRILMELSTCESDVELSELISETEQRHFYTDDYKALTGDFYARMK
jgi:tRNA1Val (adenine37-N6)-methyltransferase